MPSNSYGAFHETSVLVHTLDHDHEEAVSPGSVYRINQ